MLKSRHLLYLLAALLATCLATSADAAVPTMLWLSPRNVSYDNFVYEDFSSARGVWSDVATGAGSRTDSPVVHLDSKGMLWIYGGNPNYFIKLTQAAPMHNYTALNGVWTYDLIQDQYRWVLGFPEFDGQYVNFGQMGIAADDVFPGLKGHSAHAIDKNDMIWIYGGLISGFTDDENSQPDNTMWMFNTTSHQFTWIGGDSSNMVPIYGDLGVASEEYWPGSLSGASMVVDSKNNLWLFGGYMNFTILSTGVWMFDTSSRMWSLRLGDPMAPFSHTNSPNQIWAGRYFHSSTIDENDRVWLFGGFDAIQQNDLWSFDTKNVQWHFERKCNETFLEGHVASYDEFDVDNCPGMRYSAGMVDRRDGTIMMYGGGDYEATLNDMWIFNKTSKFWKIVHGFTFNYTSIKHVYGEYRGAGSRLGTRKGFGIESGLNANGHMIIVGGTNGGQFAFNDIWIVPQDPCLTTLHNCDPNASCLTLQWDQPYQCTCNDGYTGDGKTCTASPSVRQPSANPSAEVTSEASAVARVRRAQLTSVLLVLSMLIQLCY